LHWPDDKPGLNPRPGCHRSGSDRIFVKRKIDLPHDLCQLVVEDGFHIAKGFWGLIDDGMDVTLLDNQVVLIRVGKPLVDDPGVNFQISKAPNWLWPSLGLLECIQKSLDYSSGFGSTQLLPAPVRRAA